MLYYSSPKSEVEHVSRLGFEAFKLLPNSSAGRALLILNKQLAFLYKDLLIQYPRWFQLF